MIGFRVSKGKDQIKSCQREQERKQERTVER